MLSALAFDIFQESITDYHQLGLLDAPPTNPYPKDKIEHLFYLKNWIDTVQWHYEDLVRDPEIDPVLALSIKRKIDASNQRRTDVVEYIDSHLLDKYRSVIPLPEALINTETPAWALDRLSILALKIYHMGEEASRKDASEQHKTACESKLHTLLEQKKDLCASIDQLIKDIETGRKRMKLYKQMKMYNDDSLNPILYRKH